MKTSKVTLQINLAPSDWRHAQYILPHQLRQWAKQVDEVLLTLDLHRSQGRFGAGWETGVTKIRHLIDDCCASYPNTFLNEVDYSPEVIVQVSAMFFGGQSIPPKDYRGGAFYSYFFGLFSAKHNYVLHIDSDMLFGGGSSTWISEAIKLLAENSDVLVCAPHPGPPSNDGKLRSQVAKPEPYLSPAFRFDFFSSRIFLLDRSRFTSRLKDLKIDLAPPRGIIKALVEGNYPYNLPEEIKTKAMSRHCLYRVDFLGQSPGMWSLHPPYRSESFYQQLPELIHKIETGNVPEAQRGVHDINDSLVDWTTARTALRQNRWWKRLRKRVQHRYVTIRS